MMALALADDRIAVTPDQAMERLRMAEAATKDAESTHPDDDRVRLGIVHSVMHNRPWLLHISGEKEYAVDAYRTALATAVGSLDPVGRMLAFASFLRFWLVRAEPTKPRPMSASCST